MCTDETVRMFMYRHSEATGACAQVTERGQISVLNRGFAMWRKRNLRMCDIAKCHAT
jgi:hypothetical protein